jgi:3-hydroxyacyl-CoA dehydrogenase
MIATVTGESLVSELCSQPCFSPMVSAMRKNGQHGLKTGSGFYDWTAVENDAHQTKNNELLTAINELVSSFRKDHRIPITPPPAPRL